MKHRLLAILLVGVMAMHLAGCGSISEEEPSEPEESVAELRSQEEPEPVSEEESESKPEEEAQPEDIQEPEPATVPESPESQPESTSEDTIQPVAFSGDWNPFALSPAAGDYYLYAYRPATMIYADLGNSCVAMEPEANSTLGRAIAAINALAGTATGTVDENSVVEGGILYVAMDGTYKKHEYLLRGGMLVVDGTAYAVTAEQYATLKEIVMDDSAMGVRGGQWLIYMNPNRVFKIECTDTDGAWKQMKSDNVGLAATEPRYIDMQSGTTYTPGAVSFDGMFRTVFTFDQEGGITYTIATKGNKVYVECSDMSFACEYTTYEQQINSFITSMQGMIDGPANPRTGKPVIYLYPERRQNVEVQLDFQGELCYTFPTYDNGWRVTAEPDGTLTNQADGTTHFYLFWDGNAYRHEWDFSKGFVVKGSEVQAFFQEKLPAMGLTPREYNDFITYWTPELAANPYNLITFSTTQYEQTAPLTVTPTPDTVLRVHMVYKPLAAPIAVEEQVLPPAPARNGFTVVEWGGTRAFGQTK